MSDDEDERTPPTVIALMAEYTGDYLWNRSPGRNPLLDDYAIDPADLGVSAGLIERMTAWNDEFGAIARTDFEFPSAEAEKAWVRRGRDLAYDLQNQLPDIEVLYHHDPRGEVPVRSRHA